jgi:hypothetical protein
LVERRRQIVKLHYSIFRGILCSEKGEAITSKGEMEKMDSCVWQAALGIAIHERRRGIVWKFGGEERRKATGKTPKFPFCNEIRIFSRPIIRKSKIEN